MQALGELHTTFQIIEQVIFFSALIMLKELKELLNAFYTQGSAESQGSSAEWRTKLWQFLKPQMPASCPITILQQHMMFIPLSSPIIRVHVGCALP